jgi:hypothetical protein
VRGGHHAHDGSRPGRGGRDQQGTRCLHLEPRALLGSTRANETGWPSSRSLEDAAALPSARLYAEILKRGEQILFHLTPLLASEEKV